MQERVDDFGSDKPRNMDEAQSMAGDTFDQAKHTASENMDGTRSTMNEAKDTASEKMDEAKEKASDYAHKAQDQAEAGREKTAAGLTKAATMVRERTGETQGMPHEAGLKVADGMETAATYLQQHSTTEIWQDFEGVVREHPGKAFAGAVVAGFVIGRVLR